ncbi:DMT family transporter [Pelagibacterium limicola]|uniref:DMT family transporter n=1 Tax=Pelagibacterium limicola TaxID=2791022 RepID=UPI0018AF7DF0|nr:DMT family transporter [Pelagibacterium limicola]
MFPKSLSPAQALLVAALGIITLCMMDVFAKGMGAAFPTAQVVLMRYGSAACWLALFIVVARKAWPQRRYLKRHAMRAALMCVTAYFFFYAITHLPLAIATALAMSAPVYVGVLSALLLKERARPSVALAVLLGLAGGAVVIFGGDGSPSATGEASVLAWMAAILTPMSYALALVLLKSHSSDENAASMIFAQSALAAAIALPFAVPGFVVPDGDQWLPIAVVGFLGALGLLLFVAALRYLPASIFALVDYTALIWAAGLGFLVFGEVPGLSLGAGGALIIAACFIGMRAARASTGAPATRLDGLSDGRT